MRSCPGSSCFFEHSLGASRDTCRVRDDFEGLDSCASSGSQHLTNTGAPRKAQEHPCHGGLTAATRVMSLLRDTQGKGAFSELATHVKVHAGLWGPNSLSSNPHFIPDSLPNKCMPSGSV